MNWYRVARALILGLVNAIVRPWLIENFSMPVDFQKHPRYRRVVGIAQLAADKAKIDLSTMERTTIHAADEDVRVVDDAGNDVYLDIPNKSIAGATMSDRQRAAERAPASANGATM